MRERPRSFWLLMLLLAMASCQGDETTGIDDDPAGEDDPVLYEPENSYQAVQLAPIELRPPHRNGPVQLPGQHSVLPLTIWVPQGAGAAAPYPVIIYSHGGGARSTPGESGPDWGAAYARAGYAMIAMHHMQRTPDDVRENICGPLGVSAAECVASVYVPYYESTDRPQDAVAVMDSLTGIGSSVGATFDATRIVIAGFSGGTNTTIYLSGGTRNAIFGVSQDTAFFSIEENRPVAYIAMSPGGGTGSGWTSESLANINVPFLSATGLADLSSDIRAQLHDELRGAQQYRLYINSSSALHVTFNHSTTGNPDQQSDQAVFHQWLEAVNIAFLDAYVKGDSDALNWLRSDTIELIVNAELAEHPVFPTWSFR